MTVIILYSLLGATGLALTLTLAYSRWQSRRKAKAASALKTAAAPKRKSSTDLRAALQRRLKALFARGGRSRFRWKQHRGFQHRAPGKARASGRRNYHQWRAGKIAMTHRSRKVNR